MPKWRDSQIASNGVLFRTASSPEIMLEGLSIFVPRMSFLFFCCTLFSFLYRDRLLVFFLFPSLSFPFLLSFPILLYPPLVAVQSLTPFARCYLLRLLPFSGLFSKCSCVFNFCTVQHVYSTIYCNHDWSPQGFTYS